MYTSSIRFSVQLGPVRSSQSLRWEEEDDDVFFFFFFLEMR